MERTVFKRFYGAMEKAIACPADHEARAVWSMGFYFLNMTDKQAEQVYALLKAAYGEQINEEGKQYVTTPAGLWLVRR